MKSKPWLARIVCLLAVAMLGASPLSAAKVATWRHASRTDFAKGKPESVVLGAAGEITLARKLERVADLKAGSVWALAEAKNRLLAGTAEPGQIVEITPDGKTRQLWTSDKVQVFSLLARDDGSVLAGTGPDGKVIKIDEAGKASDFATLDATYIWDLAADKDGTVYAGTGPKGRIYKLANDGSSSVHFETHQAHVMTLAFDAQGRLLAGTDGGLVLAVQGQNGRVLYDTGGMEVRALWPGPQDVLYFGTAQEKKSSSSSSRSSSSSTSGANPPGTNFVYRIDSTGGVTEVLKTSSMVYCLGGKGPDDLVAGTGTAAQIYSVDPMSATGRQLAKIDADQVLSMLETDNGKLFFGTGNPARVYSLSRGYVAEGTLVSEPLDASMVAHFGALNWSAETPPGTEVSVAVRSGNTTKPGENWSAWSNEQRDPDRAAAGCPAGRFLQYRLTLKSKDPQRTPEVRSVVLRYRTSNQRPQITKFTVPHVDEEDGKSPITKLKLTWTAADPNKDDLSYSLSFRKPEWKTWVKLKDNLTDANFEWDVTSVPQGNYLLRLNVTDRPSNPDAEALDANKISEPFVIDCQGPKVTAKLANLQAGVASFEAESHDDYSPIVAASYSLDSGRWVNVFPQDRLFDTPHERFKFDVEGLKPGLHVLVIRSTDAAGHTSSADVVFPVDK